MSEELKNCPRCGGKEKKLISKSYGLVCDYKVRCINCGFHTETWTGININGHIKECNKGKPHPAIKEVYDSYEAFFFIY